ncbi:universal stress protein [Streptomyces sp. Ru87]|uniref:universal stress protein n=1 Tax=Streptomyces sp. Ru87 TaxID=2044307 RepID=UPI00211D98C7|nr:universal stress protein [Streptomyces sp. Ru87]
MPEPMPEPTPDAVPGPGRLPGPVVAGVDGSRAGGAAAEWAAHEASARRLPLLLLHAWSWEPVDMPVTQDEETHRRLAEDMLRSTERGLRERHPGLEITAERVPQPAVDSLVEGAEGAEMLVLGSRRYGPVLGFLLGSVGLRVLGRAGCPVVMVRGDESPRPERDEVVAGLRGTSAQSGPVLAFAFAAAAAHGLRVRAVRAWSPPTVFSYSPSAMRLADEHGGIEAHEEKLLEDALAPWRERFPQVPVTTRVEIGSGTEVLLTSSARARLLVIGRRASSGGRHLGPAAHATLHHADCPVAVVAHP